MGESERLERERAFHNRAFVSPVRRHQAAFYSVWGESIRFYERLLMEHAPAGASVLEYGCGPGSHAFFLAERAARVVGIDISEEAIGQARAVAASRGIGRADFRVMNAQALEFPESSFDLVCGSGILHHLDLQRAYSELARVLRPAGVAVFLEPLGHNPFINLYRRLTPASRTEDEHPLVARDFRLAERYFEHVNAKPFHLSALAAVPLRRTRAFAAVLNALGRLDTALFAAIPPLAFWGWIAIVTLGSPRVEPGPNAEPGAHHQ